MFFKPDSFKDYLIHIALIVVVTIGIFIYFFNYYLPEYTHHGEEIKVPALADKSISTVEKMLAASKLEMVLNDSAYVPDKEPGIVISQHPLSGSEVKAGRKIYLTITSTHPMNVKMPDLRNKTYKSAQLTLSQIDLKIGQVRYVDDPFPLVLRQMINGKDINPGAMIPKYSKVNLIIGDGKGKSNEQNSATE